MIARSRVAGTAVLAVALIALPCGSGRASPAGEDAGDAARRLAVAIERAERGGAPDRARRAAEIEAARRDARARAGAFAPYVELQREGLEPDLDDAPNAAAYLRLGTPLATPGQVRAGRDVHEAGARWSTQAARAAERERARIVASLWLELARADDRLAVLRARLDRLARATELQGERRRVGEVAGADVEQLDLERARLDALLSGEEAVRAGLRARLVRRTGDPGLEPRPGDLQALRAAGRAPLPASEALRELVEGAPALRASRREAELAAAAARLERSTARGRPVVEVEYESIPDLGPADGFDAYGLRLHVPLPFGRAARETRAAAAARRRAAELSSETAHRDVLARARAELETARLAEGALARLASTAADLDALAGALAERFRLGAVDYLVYLDALNRLDEVRLQRVDTLHALLAARLELQALGVGAGLFPLPADDAAPDSGADDGAPTETSP